MRRSDRNFTKIPDGKLGIIALEGCKELGKTIYEDDTALIVEIE